MKVKGLAILLLFFLASCAKVDDFIADVPVNFSAPLTDPRLNRLSSIGGAAVIDGHGIAGLLVYRGANNVIVAYDRCSTVNPQQRNAVVLDDPSLTATDLVSGAKFLLMDGSPVKAPAVVGLKRYSARIAGNNLVITN